MGGNRDNKEERIFIIIIVKLVVIASDLVYKHLTPPPPPLPSPPLPPPPTNPVLLIALSLRLPDREQHDHGQDKAGEGCYSECPSPVSGQQDEVESKSQTVANVDAPVVEAEGSGSKTLRREKKKIITHLKTHIQVFQIRNTSREYQVSAHSR